MLFLRCLYFILFTFIITDEIVYQIKNSKANTIVTIPEKLEAVLEAKSILEQENFKLRIICTDTVLGQKPELPNGIDKYASFVADNVDESQLSSLQTAARSTNDIAFIPYSSGTTGRPKGVCLTHRNLMANTIAMELVNDVAHATSKISKH